MATILTDSGRITQKSGASRWVELALSPPYMFVRIFRLSMWLYGRGGVLRVLSKFVRNIGVAIYGSDLAPSAKIGGAILFPHPIGIVIGKGVCIGRNATIYQHVTIGARGGLRHHAGYPTVGDNVTIYPGAVVVGGIVIGNDVTIGANSVVLQSVDEGATVAGNPARTIRAPGWASERQVRSP